MEQKKDDLYIKDDLYKDVSFYVESALVLNDKKDWTKMEFCMIRDATLENLRSEGIVSETYTKNHYAVYLMVFSEIEMMDFYYRFRTFGNTNKRYDGLYTNGQINS